MAESRVVIKEANSVANFGREMINHMEAKRNDFMMKGTVGLWWDSKVPEDEKQLLWFLHCFSLKFSDKNTVLKEIEKYIELYKIIESVPSCSFDEIEKVDEKVREGLRRAEKQMKRTSSKTIYNISKDLLLSKLSKNIEKIKDELGTYEFKKLRENFKKVVENESEKFTKQYKMEIEQLLNENARDAEETQKMKQNYQKRLQELGQSVKYMEGVLQNSNKLAESGNKSCKSVTNQEIGHKFVEKKSLEDRSVAVGIIEHKFMEKEKIEGKPVAEEVTELSSVANELGKGRPLVIALGYRPITEKTVEDKSAVIEVLKGRPAAKQKLEDKLITEKVTEATSTAEEKPEDRLVTKEKLENKSVAQETAGEKFFAEELVGKSIEEERLEEESTPKKCELQHVIEEKPEDRLVTKEKLENKQETGGETFFVEELVGKSIEEERLEDESTAEKCEMQHVLEGKSEDNFVVEETQGKPISEKLEEKFIAKEIIEHKPVAEPITECKSLSEETEKEFLAKQKFGEKSAAEEIEDTFVEEELEENQSFVMYSLIQGNLTAM